MLVIWIATTYALAICLRFDTNQTDASRAEYEWWEAVRYMCCKWDGFCEFELLFSPTKRLLFNNLEFRMPINRIEIVFYLFFMRFSFIFPVFFIEKRARTSFSSHVPEFLALNTMAMQCAHSIKNDWFYDCFLPVLCVCQVHEIMVGEREKIVWVFVRFCIITGKKKFLCAERSMKWCLNQMSLRLLFFLFSLFFAL